MGSAKAFAQQSTYVPNGSAADYSGMTANGGTIIVPWVLDSGVAVDGLGTSFNVTYTVSAITPLNDAGPYRWGAFSANDTPYVGYGFPTMADGLYANTPPMNRVSPPAFLRGISYLANASAWMKEGLADGLFVATGAFSVSTSALPSVIGYNVAGQNVRYLSSADFVGTGTNTYDNVTSGMGSWIVGSNTVNFGDTVDFQFLEIHDLTMRIPPNSFSPIWFSNGSVVFEVQAIPEPGTVALLLLSSAFLPSLARRYYEKNRA